MSNARMLMVVVLIIGVGPVAWGDEQTETEESQRRRDQLHIAIQEICPISGLKLGQHGTPIKVTVGEHKEQIFLCCKACLKRKINPKHWATIHANFAEAQGICPVMKHELPTNPRWTIVQGQIVYVCCPPCTDKIAKNPQVYLSQIDKLYLAALHDKQTRR